MTLAPVLSSVTLRLPARGGREPGGGQTAKRSAGFALVERASKLAPRPPGWPRSGLPGSPGPPGRLKRKSPTSRCELFRTGFPRGPVGRQLLAVVARRRRRGRRGRGGEDRTQIVKGLSPPIPSTSCVSRQSGTSVYTILPLPYALSAYAQRAASHCSSKP